jgi:S1-C subfamily serine protease
MAFNRGLIRLGAAALVVLLAGSAWAAAGFAGPGSKSGGQGYLGITFQDVNDSEISSLRLKDGHGAEILMVDHDGPAGKAGLREHDVVLSLNGMTVDGQEMLHKMLHDMQPGRTVSLTVCRDGSERTVNATLGNRAEVEKQAMESRWTVPSPTAGQDELFAPADAPAAPKTGFAHNFMPGHILDTFTPAYTGATVDAMGTQLADFFGVKDGKGLLVHDVVGNSPAAAAGLHAGDVVTRINGARVGTEKDWTRALRDSKGHPVSLTVVRDRKEQMLTMVPDSKKRSSVEQPAQSPDGPVTEPRPILM